MTSLQSKWVNQDTHTPTEQCMGRRDEAPIFDVVLLCRRSRTGAQMQCTTRKVWARQGSRWVHSEPDSCPARGHPCIVIIRHWRAHHCPLSIFCHAAPVELASLPLLAKRAPPHHATTANGHFSRSRASHRPLSPPPRYTRLPARCHPPPELTTAAAAVWADDTTSGSG